MLAPVAGRPFMAHLLDQLEGAGFRRVVLCIGYKGQEVLEALGSSGTGSSWSIPRGKIPLGTAGALRQALLCYWAAICCSGYERSLPLRLRLGNPGALAPGADGYDQFVAGPGVRLRSLRLDEFWD
ncbi:hypothetical protein DFAR_1470022 [Desulfarculales bacterium]